MQQAARHEHLTDLFAFARLVLGLEPGEAGYKDERTERLIKDIAKFLTSPTDEAFAARSAAVTQLLRHLCISHHPRLPELYDAVRIGKEFRELESRTDVSRLGIEYGWLAQRFKAPSILLPFELPPHARVGFGFFAGGLALEEADLLGDACFLLLQARTAHQQFLQFVENRADSASVEDRRREHTTFTAMNLNVGTFARLGVLTSAAFVESFVNSVGHAEASRRPRPAEEADYLRGRSKHKFATVSEKLEVFPALIRPDGRSPLKVRDPRQRQEPFTSFLAATKEVRDAAMHFAPGKAAIIRNPVDWMALVEQAVLGSVAVARAFWSATYEGVGFPKYLDELNVERLLGEAERRMTATALSGPGARQ